MPSDQRSVRRRVTHAIRLTESRQLRDSTRTFLVQGIRNVIAAVENGFTVEQLFVSRILLKSAVGRNLVQRLKEQGVLPCRLTPEQFRPLCGDQRASGLAVIVRQRTLPLPRLLPAAADCWTVMTHVRSPGNLGCLIRSSAAMGASGFILVGHRIDPWNSAVARASMGAVFHQPIIRTHWNELIRWAGQHPLQIVGASADGTVSCSDFHFRPPILLLLGNERKGLDRQQRQFAEHLVRIPMVPKSDSLNLSVAGAVMLYEIRRSANPSH